MTAQKQREARKRLEQRRHKRKLAGLARRKIRRARDKTSWSQTRQRKA